MGNETQKDFQHQQNTGTSDPNKKNPTHQGGQNPNQQDPSRKNPSQIDDPRRKDNEEDSAQGEKRRAS